jgi:septation ring formation regulator EzrA
MEIMENNQVRRLETKTTINQIKTTVDSIITRQDQTEERISEVEDKIEEFSYCMQTITKEKMNTTYEVPGT